MIDDDVSMREALKNLLRSVGLDVQTYGAAQEFLASHRADVPGCLVLDVRLPGLSGLDLQRRLAEASIQIPIIFITGHGDIQMSVRAMKAGAIEFLTNRSAIRISSTPSKRPLSGTGLQSESRGDSRIARLL